MDVTIVKQIHDGAEGDRSNVVTLKTAMASTKDDTVRDTKYWESCTVESYCYSVSYGIEQTG